VPFALVIEVFVFFADAQLADAHHAQAALRGYPETVFEKRVDLLDS